MRLLVLATLVLVCCAPAQEWEVLFDGTSTEAWRGLRDSPFPEEAWEVHEGLLAAKPGNMGRDPVSRDEYQSFELRFDWRISEGGNSGVKYLVDEEVRNRYRGQLYGLLFGWLAIAVVVLYGLRKRPKLMAPVAGLAALVAAFGAHEIGQFVRYSSTGLEMQLLDNERHPNGREDEKRAGSLYGLYAATEDATKPAGGWNTSRIIVSGADVEHWINGVRVVHYGLGSAELGERVGRSGSAKIEGFGQRRPGRIVLQHHSDPVWFRDIRIRRLGNG